MSTFICLAAFLKRVLCIWSTCLGKLCLLGVPYEYQIKSTSNTNQKVQFAFSMPFVWRLFQFVISLKKSEIDQMKHFLPLFCMLYGCVECVEWVESFYLATFTINAHCRKPQNIAKTCFVYNLSVWMAQRFYSALQQAWKENFAHWSW